MLRPRLAFTAAALAVTLVPLVGCGGGTGASTAVSSPPTSSPSSAVARPVGHYKLVDNLCDHVDLAAITKVLPQVAEEMDELDNPVPNARNCTGTLGLSKDPDEQGTFDVLVEVFGTNAEAEDHYEAFRSTNVNMSRATNVQGIGQKAYQYTVPIKGSQPAVRVLDGNAVFTCEWIPNAELSTPAGLVDALTETLRGTLASLQSA